MMKLFIVPLIIISMFISGCGLTIKPKVPYDNIEKVLLTSAIGAQAVDYTSTVDGFSRGCGESNSLYGKDPSNGTIMIGKIITSGIIWIMANNVDDHKIRKGALGIATVIGGATAYHNYSLECRGN